MPTLNFNLLQNSHAFVNEALAKAILAEEDPPQWQFAIFCLVQAIELGLKERLRREHTVLIYKNIDDRRTTVSVETAASRLRDLAKVNITDTDLATIRRAIQWRNLIVHHEFEFTTDVLKPVFAKLLGFLVDFYKTNLHLFLADHVTQEHWEEALAITEYAEELARRAEMRIRTEGIDPEHIWTCPRCGNETFVIQQDTDTCYVCNFQDAVSRCDDCGERFFRRDLHEVVRLVTRNREVASVLCDNCYEKHERIEDEEFFDPDW